MMWRVAQFCMLTCLFAGTSARAADIDFSRAVRPILADKCYACHGPDQQQRQGGDEESGGLHFDTKQGAFADLGGRFAIVPGRPEDSELIRRIQSSDPDEAMPPADHPKQLSPPEKQILVDWIRQGAVWRDHWAFVPPVRHAAPKTVDTEWSRNLIDSFILARLEQAKLKPSPQADERTLIRRLSLDLVGLPPTAEEMKAYLSDSSPKAYESIVDHLLKSPHYGERMAVHWLDVVRYADTVGYHGDQPMSVSPYRDYVIDAFNDNMPFDQMTREQLAGDLLPNATLQQQIASGYNRLGMMSAEGGVQPKEYLAKYASDRVRTAATVWLGSTLGCAECHEHKFDSFTSKDFYRFAAFFADIKEKGLYDGSHASGRWGPQIDVPNDELPELLNPIDALLAKLQQTLDTPTDAIRAAQRAWESRTAKLSAEWKILKPTAATSKNGAKLTVLENHSVLASEANPNQDTYTVTATVPLKNVTGFRIEALPDKSLPKNGPGRAGNGNFVITEFRVLRSAGLDSQPMAVPLANARATFEQAGSGDPAADGKWSATQTVDGDAKGSDLGWAILPEAGQPNHLVVEAGGMLANDGESEFTFVIEQNHSGPQHTLGRFRLWASSAELPLKAEKISLPPQKIQQLLALPAVERNKEQPNELAKYYRSIAESLAETRKQLDETKKQKQETIAAHSRATLVTVSVEPRTIRVLPRGNWMDESGEIVAPGVPHFLRQLRTETEERADRRDLATWLTARDNPLTARVFVNRLWKLYFGTGLSKVLDDFGAQGEPPSHPKLLDTLAVEFMESGWNIKHLVKLIVMSATYRQSSLIPDELRDVDPYNRLLARQSRFRMDAEFIRDSALAVSGLLVPEVGGRSVKPYQPAGMYRHLNFPARSYKHDVDDNQYRRGVYTHWQRQFLHPAMKAFDAPAREECTAERPRSNTPLAALVLLNDPSYVEAARVFAEHAIDRGGTETGQRIAWIMTEALSRDPQPEELALLGRLLAAQLEYYKKHPEQAEQLINTGLAKPAEEIDPVELASWTALTRTVFNLHEFITRN